MKAARGDKRESSVLDVMNQLGRLIRLEPTCIRCGCTELNACRGGCAWTFLNQKTNEGICSACFELLLDRHGREELLSKRSR